MLLVVFVAFGTHVTGQIIHRPGHRLGIALVGQTADHPLDIFAVMLVGDPPLRIGHAMGRDGQFLTRRLRIGRIHIQLKIRHDEEVVPQFVGEVGRIAQQGVQIAHDGDHGAGLTVAFAAVLDRQQRVDHLLDVTPVFGQVQLASRVIIVLSHKLYLRSFPLLRFVRRTLRQGLRNRPVQDVFQDLPLRRARPPGIGFTPQKALTLGQRQRKPNVRDTACPSRRSTSQK